MVELNVVSVAFIDDATEKISSKFPSPDKGGEGIRRIRLTKAALNMAGAFHSSKNHVSANVSGKHGSPPSCGGRGEDDSVAS